MTYIEHIDTSDGTLIEVHLNHPQTRQIVRILNSVDDLLKVVSQLSLTFDVHGDTIEIWNPDRAPEEVAKWFLTYSDFRGIIVDAKSIFEVVNDTHQAMDTKTLDQWATAFDPGFFVHGNHDHRLMQSLKPLAQQHFSKIDLDINLTNDI